MTIKQWMFSQSRTTYILAAIALILLVLFSVNKYNSNKQNQINIDNAVLQHMNEELSASNVFLEQQLIGHKTVEDSLWKKLKDKENVIIQLNKKVVIISAKYQDELNRLSQLPDEDAVGEFLDASNCGKLPILKYDTSYLIPVCPIRMYNNIRVERDMQKDLNNMLSSKIDNQGNQIFLLNGIIIEKKEAVTLLDSINRNHVKIEGILNEQIKLEVKKTTIQKRKTWITGISGGILILGILLLK